MHKNDIRFRAGQVRNQLRTNEKSCGLADFGSLKLQTCGCGLFLILVLNSASFVQILKFLSIFAKYLCFYPAKHGNSI